MTQSLSVWLKEQLATGEPVVAVTVAKALGSTPREGDALLLVTTTATLGTVGGGTIEWTAIDRAREMILAGCAADSLSMPLGPMSGQCCGGHVTLDFSVANAEFAAALAHRESAMRAAAPQLLVFGAGHVGRAIARAVLPLPVRLSVIDTRDEELALLPDGVDRRVVEDPAAVVNEAETQASFLIMTHSHTLDFLIAEAALARCETPYVGMIGSATKRARFRSWASQRGLPHRSIERLICPIGGTRLRDKRPEVIAALVAAEIISRVLGTSQELKAMGQRRSA